MWEALMIGTGFVAGVAGTVALAVRWYAWREDEAGFPSDSWKAGYFAGLKQR